MLNDGISIEYQIKNEDDREELLKTSRLIADKISSIIGKKIVLDDCEWKGFYVAVNNDYKSNYYKINRTNETNVNKDGKKITIVKYVRYNEIYVKIEDGTIIKTHYKAFLEGIVGYNQNKTKDHLGNEFISEKEMCANIMGLNVEPTISE